MPFSLLKLLTLIFTTSVLMINNIIAAKQTSVMNTDADIYNCKELNDIIDLSLHNNIETKAKSSNNSNEEYWAKTDKFKSSIEALGKMIKSAINTTQQNHVNFINSLDDKLKRRDNVLSMFMSFVIYDVLYNIYHDSQYGAGVRDLNDDECFLLFVKSFSTLSPHINDKKMIQKLHNAAENFSKYKMHSKIQKSINISNSNKQLADVIYHDFRCYLQQFWVINNGRTQHEISVIKSINDRCKARKNSIEKFRMAPKYSYTPEQVYNIVCAQFEHELGAIKNDDFKTFCKIYAKNLSEEQLRYKSFVQDLENIKTGFVSDVRMQSINNAVSDTTKNFTIDGVTYITNMKRMYTNSVCDLLLNNKEFLISITADDVAFSKTIVNNLPNILSFVNNTSLFKKIKKMFNKQNNQFVTKCNILRDLLVQHCNHCKAFEEKMENLGCKCHAIDETVARLVDEAIKRLDSIFDLDAASKLILNQMVNAHKN